MVDGRVGSEIHLEPAAEKQPSQPRSVMVPGDCPVGGEGSTDAGLEDTPGAGQGRVKKVALPGEKPHSQVAL